MTADWTNRWQGKWKRDDSSAGELYGPEGHRQVADHICDLAGICPRHSVIDIGCGTGHVLANLAASEKVGIDIYPIAAHPERAAFFRENKIRYQQGIATDLPNICSNSFDFAIMHGVSQFLDESEMELCIYEMERVSRLGVVILDIVHREKEGRHTALRKAMPDRTTLPPQLSHRPETFMAHGYCVADVKLELTIGWQNKFDAWKVAVK